MGKIKRDLNKWYRVKDLPLYLQRLAGRMTKLDGEIWVYGRIRKKEAVIYGGVYKIKNV